VDPALVVPKELELPLGVDLSFHLAPALFLLVDLLLLSPPWTINFVPALGLSTGIAFAYWFWIECKFGCLLRVSSVTCSHLMETCRPWDVL
jgi:hypothetical protein